MHTLAHTCKQLLNNILSKILTKVNKFSEHGISSVIRNRKNNNIPGFYDIIDDADVANKFKFKYFPLICEKKSQPKSNSM